MEARPLRKVLIANRGEIAMRVLRACEAEGVVAATVHSDADASGLWVKRARESHRIGPAPVAQSYLNVDAILDAAKRSGCDALHPGYGLLSESAAFARRVVEAGLAWIGPTPETMEAMGSKTNARAAMRAAGVPVVPGTTEAIDDLERAKSVARELGYPVMVKASSGGGGIGMELARDEAALERAMKGVADRARRFFGGGAVYLEKALARPRHVEVQVLGDAHGNLVHLFERECSIQRRHQKVVEEAPAPIADASLRASLAETAVRAARAAGYRNAGTVEFLLDEGGHFYFLEMNCRVQVEHPVTEAITGVDIVREQLRIASGRALSFGQGDVRARGAAIECRLYAEDPSKGFLPSPGPIEELSIPEGEGIRVDAGYAAGDVVTPFYDPLLAKLVFSGRDRAEA
ncbi:MAG TPA: biotin carboxylase N-terminal domain-containing protein, partial [Planctomycetota bacterium]|nr:biotin carboxylase N-terminal domain-containing protein [Planctomycetota bacterium]